MNRIVKELSVKDLNIYHHMAEIKIRRELLEMLFALGKAEHPNEFLAILKEKDGIIEELELAPGTVSNGVSASFNYDMMPLSTNTAGSAHSHPSGLISPSDADLNMFPKIGRYHIIIGSPYNNDTWRAFRANGDPYDMEVVD